MTLELIVLTVKAVKGAGVIEDGKVVMTILGSCRGGIPGIAASGAGRANKGAHAVCGQRIVVIRKVSFMGPAALDPAGLHPPEAAETGAAGWYAALVRTKPAG